MHVEPDAVQAVHDRTAALELLAGVLRRVSEKLSVEDDTLVTRVRSLSSEELSFPGMFAATYDAQAVCRSGMPPEDERARLVARLRRAVADAAASEQRAAGGPYAGWPVDLAPGGQHLTESLARAVAQVPKTPERADDLAKVRIVAWNADDRAGFAEACSLLDLVWPSMLEEMAIVIRQAALLGSFGIDGFTDVATHGAVYVNRARLGDDDAGLPGRVRFAEALVHEATHNSCNAAALSDPFLADRGTGSEPVVMTPLRRDARPLTGLLQQLAVIARCVLLYDRLLDGSTSMPAAVGARRVKLFGQGLDAVRTLRSHTGMLTDHGAAIVMEADLVLASGRGTLATGGHAS